MQPAADGQIEDWFTLSLGQYERGCVRLTQAFKTSAKLDFLRKIERRPEPGQANCLKKELRARARKELSMSRNDWLEVVFGSHIGASSQSCAINKKARRALTFGAIARPKAERIGLHISLLRLCVLKNRLFASCKTWDRAPRREL
jgi:hypothetical protein